MKKSLLIFLAAALCFCFVGAAAAAKDASPEPSMKTVPTKRLRLAKMKPRLSQTATHPIALSRKMRTKRW